MADSDVFKYVSYSLSDDRKLAVFEYQLTHNGKPHTLKENLVFDSPLPDNVSVSQALRALHLCLGISYYKIFLPPTIEHSYSMEQTEADFWNDIFKGGLGEFLYVNKLSTAQVAEFKPKAGQPAPDLPTDLLNSQTATLGLGGGKDSIVAGELLKKLGINIEAFVMATGEQLGQTKPVAEVMQVPLHAVKRSLDPLLLELQEEPGAYKGHIPVSLIFGFVGTALALSLGSAFVVVANESSASMPSFEDGGLAVHHQWSKSFEVEKKLQAYIKKYIHPGLTYFSAIRPLGSVAVAKRFAQLTQYFEVFTSDNFVFRIDPKRRPSDRWSLESPKSLSSFILMAPWLEEDAMLKIFGRDFLNEPSLSEMFLRLTGVEGQPPLDCVGTVDELVVSLNLLIRQGKFAYSRLIELANERKIVRAEDWDGILEEMLKLSPDSAFPEILADKLNQELARG